MSMCFVVVGVGVECVDCVDCWDPCQSVLIGHAPRMMIGVLSHKKELGHDLV